MPNAPSNPSFEKWLRAMSKNDIEVAAKLLKSLMALNSMRPIADRLSSEYVRATGDKVITEETYKKAAQIAFRNAAEKEKE